MTWPNFLVIGAGKSGTTSLYHYLSDHPEIFMSPMKGPRFFAMEGERPDFRGPRDEVVNERTVTDRDAYLALFDGVTSEKAIGEASDWYLSSSKARDAIRRYLPDAKLIAILRDPAERAFSSYMHFGRHGYEPLPFEQALDAEPERLRQGWSPLFEHKGRGFYARQLRGWYDVFPREQIRVYLYEDLQRDPLALMRDIYAFLGVSTEHRPPVDVVYNKSGTPRSRLLHRLVSQGNPLKRALRPLLPRPLRKRVKAKLQEKNLGREALPPGIRRKLIAEYRSDILELQDLIGRDLSAWLR